ncbi:MAG: metallophosphoesterase [Rhodocyclales bacterium]|nr:metallophosphoesterase [Rhodocyclales bacterium]
MAPPDTVIYAIGDIHGRCDLLAELHAGIAADAARRAEPRPVMVYLGDYVSRGRDSRRVVDLVLAAAAPGIAKVCLRGNHEDLLLRYLGGDLKAGRFWFDYDGMDALENYGVAVPDRRVRDDRSLEELRQAFAAALPPAHLDFFRSLVVSHDAGGYRFVHGGVRPGVALARQTEHDQVWLRQPFLDSDDDHGAVVVHGHSMAAEPQVRCNRIGIDTGAYRSGVLTCLVLAGGARRFLQAVA